ncbi:MACPF domain-containing protein [Sphingobacterium sp. lm-10]|uniref:MAC/perforin domain-containing protein n=1 Tax=Sphingobacterium sp. lm-10 TaxID=2944904 RepID=UPI002021F2AF|nr:MAC/perforin domain-containing protein [Sphingobacterium sp. lm-10]MCL7987140.1 MACPF domain-containing protein [Sphingobacterium sp. lm-10]
MKLKLIGTFLLLATMVGCSVSELENLNDQDQIDQEIKKRKSTISRSVMAASDHGPTNLIGHGYDATGLYANRVSAKLAVIDVPKFIANNNERFIDDVGVNDDFRYIIADNAESYSDSLSININSGFGVKKMFRTEINASFGGSSAYHGSYSLASANKRIFMRTLRLATAVEDLRNNYLSREFLEDLEKYSPQDLVEFYGTHVLTHIHLGAKFCLGYKTETNTENKHQSVAAGLALNGLQKVWNVKVDFAYNHSAANSNSKQQINYRSIGGDGSKGLVGEMILDGKTPQKINIDNWQSTVNLKNAVLIEYGKNGMVPIYEFISNPTKREYMKIYLEWYLNKNSTKITLNKIPVYRYYWTWAQDHIYDPRPNLRDYDSNLQKEHIPFYVYNYQAPNSVPVYKYYIKSYKSHVYYTDPNLQRRNSDLSNQGIIFYVPKATVPGAVPIYKHFHASMHDHTFERNNYFIGWENQGIVFYAFPKPQ